jgi:geranylgeranyl diphosphate synthase type II
LNNNYFHLPDYLTRRRKIIDTALGRIFQPTDLDQRIVAAMRYTVTGNGKRLRPVLCIAAAEAVGGTFRDVLLPACALELVHTYSLIHDDLPAMDDDDLRRGKPTCHAAFDEATAILAGDALLTLAFELLTDSTDNISALKAQVRLRIIRVIAQAAGYQGMIEGQMRDILSEGKQLSITALKSSHALKTGALISAAVETWATMAGGFGQQIARLREYAGNIGLAFQVADDILNVEGDPDRMGKAVGTDAARQKNTYPALLGLEASKTLADELVNHAIETLESFDDTADPLRAIAKYIIERKR